MIGIKMTKVLSSFSVYHSFKIDVAKIKYAAATSFSLDTHPSLSVYQVSSILIMIKKPLHLRPLHVENSPVKLLL